MIYTVTLNPALDRTIYIEKLSTEAPSRILREESYAAGKGIDVSRVLLELGFESIAIGFLGGYTGKQIEGLLFNEGINMHFISVRGETRTNIIIHTFEGEEYVLNAEGPMILPDELAAFYDYVKKLPRKPSYVAISGSLPRGISPRIYEQLTILFESQGARVIVDSSGEALNFALKSTPFMIKPNLAEFQELTGRRLESVDEIVDEAIKVHNMGVEFVVVSMKENGAIGVTSSGVIWAKPPNVFAKNSVGAGDSLVAGVIAALESGKDYVEALTLGVASGTATALKEGTAKANKDDVLQILKEVTIKRI